MQFKRAHRNDTSFDEHQFDFQSLKDNPQCSHHLLQQKDPRVGPPLLHLELSEEPRLNATEAAVF